MIRGEGINLKTSFGKNYTGSKVAQKLIDEIIKQIKSFLASWAALAANHNITENNVELIKKASKYINILLASQFQIFKLIFHAKTESNFKILF